MKKMKMILSLIASFGLVIGCHAQVPPATSHTVTLSWTAPSANSNWTGCTTAAPCVYAVYRCTGTAVTCADTTTSAWREVTTALTRPSGTTYVDATATGLQVTYVVTTVQGSSSSGPSNLAAVTVPGAPVAPPLNAPTVAQNEAPQPGPLNVQELASLHWLQPLHLKAELR